MPLTDERKKKIVRAATYISIGVLIGSAIGIMEYNKLASRVTKNYGELAREYHKTHELAQLYADVLNDVDAVQTKEVRKRMRELVDAA